MVHSQTFHGRVESRRARTTEIEHWQQWNSREEAKDISSYRSQTDTCKQISVRFEGIVECKQVSKLSKIIDNYIVIAWGAKLCSRLAIHFTNSPHIVAP